MKKTLQQRQKEINGAMNVFIAARLAKITLEQKNTVEIEGIWKVLNPYTPLDFFSLAC